MTVNCSICLSIFKEPVCLPCGHIYCSKCLSDHINAPPNEGMTASCPECRTNFNIFAPELACLPRQYHQFILPSVRRVYLDLSACSALQAKLEQAEARLRVHKNHEEALAKRCESLYAALSAHRVGESEALHNVKILQKEMSALAEDRQHEIDGHISRYQQLDRQHQALHGKYMRAKMRCEELDEKVQAGALQAEQEDELRLKRAGCPRTPPRRLATELRMMKPLPKRRSGRTLSSSPPPVYNNLSKRPRLSQGTTQRVPTSSSGDCDSD